jgi:hypothetical protein
MPVVGLGGGIFTKGADVASGGEVIFGTMQGRMKMTSPPHLVFQTHAPLHSSVILQHTKQTVSMKMTPPPARWL